MSITNSSDNPTSNLIILHFATSAVLFLCVTLLLFLSANSLTGHYFQPKILAITHLTVLGWITMIIFGALYQLVPVITETRLFSFKLSFVSFICLITGTVLLAYSFWYFAIGITIQLAAIILLLAATGFVVNIFMTMQKSKYHKIEMDFILSATFWFWLTVFVGSLLAFNFRYDFIPKEHLYYLKIHAHIGLIGWFLFLIIGVSSKLIPMFLLSSKINTKKLIFAFYFLHAGLIGFSIDSFFFNGLSRAPFYLLLILTGIVFYIAFILHAYKKRIRKKLDIGLRHSFVSILFIAIPVTLVILSYIDFDYGPGFHSHLSIACGFSVLFGFIGLLILGQTYKTLPFIIWLKRYQGFSSSDKAPLPKDLYSTILAMVQLVLFISGYLIVITGILTSISLMIYLGSFIMLLASIVYNINVFKIILHKPIPVHE